MKIAVVGSGNVAWHLEKGLKGKVEVAMVNPRTLDNLPDDADIVLISVSDNAIGEVAHNLVKKIETAKNSEEPHDSKIYNPNLSSAIICHTSGSMDLEEIRSLFPKTGVFYPLQTFTKGVEVDYNEVPVFVEGSDMAVTNKLKELGEIFSHNIKEASSETRRKLHLASVFANNFVNRMAVESKNLLEKEGFDFSVVVPLLKQTVKKLETCTPESSQTGPAVRGDTKVMDKHIEMLSSDADLQEIYRLISKRIKNNYEI